MEKINTSVSAGGLKSIEKIKITIIFLQMGKSVANFLPCAANYLNCYY